MPEEAVRIVLVEDNPGDVYLFGLALKETGLNYELTVIEDGAKALALVREVERALPDLIVLDLNLPKNDGVEILEAIRKDQRFDDVPVVVASSSPVSVPMGKEERARVARFVGKPTELDKFLAMGQVLKEVLVESRARRDR